MRAGVVDAAAARARRGEIACAAGAASSIAVFVGLATIHLRLPGIYYDELFQLTPALAFVKGGLGSAVAWVPGTEISVAGHPLPLMAHSYIGAVKTIAFVPVAAVFGISPTSVRVFTVTVAALALAFTYLFARRLFRSSLTASVAVLLLATDPSFSFYSRVDFGPSVFMFLLKAIGLWQLLDWWRSRRLRSLLIGSFAFGLGVYDKANFLWIAAAVPVAAFLVAPRAVRARLDRRSAAWAGLAFALGCLPFLAYNVSWPPRTLQPALKGTLHVSGGNPSGNVFTQFELRVEQLLRLLDGETVARLLTSRGGGFPLLPILTLVAVAVIAAGYAATRLRPHFLPAMFVVVSGAIVLAASAVTPGGSYPHHVLLAYPAPHLAIAAAFGEAWALLRGRAQAGAVAVAAAAIAGAVAVGAMTTTRVLSDVRRTGGRGNFSDGVYALNRYLLAHDRSHRLVILDWGIFQNLVALSEGKLKADELYGELTARRRLRGRLLRRLDDTTARYVLHAPQATNFPRARRRFFGAVRASGRRARLEHRVTTRRGRPLFEVYRLS